ncbi:unnamed protein product [Urochloa decumbens]|uniref:Complex III subunit VI n=1 Tax=Urochloa decumbens TaxID=240449 RepID=A0ABC8W794_9POAL
MADAEPVDPKNYLEERCKPQCVKSLYDYERCMKRIENDGSGQKHCTGQYFDYWSCVDKCVRNTFLLNSCGFTLLTSVQSMSNSLSNLCYRLLQSSLISSNEDGMLLSM